MTSKDRLDADLWTGTFAHAGLKSNASNIHLVGVVVVVVLLVVVVGFVVLLVTIIPGPHPSTHHRHLSLFAQV